MISLQTTIFGNKNASSYFVNKTDSTLQLSLSVPARTLDTVTISSAGEQSLQKPYGTKTDFDSSVSVNPTTSRLFSDDTDSFTNLSRFLGLEESAVGSQSFIVALNKKIVNESNQLTTDLKKLLDKAKLGDVTKKITFSEDNQGNIVIEGTLPKYQKKKLEKLLNADTKLVERIKTQKARMDVLAELNRAEQDDSDGFNLGGNELRPLLSMKRGVLEEATGETPDFKEQIQSLKRSISQNVRNYNDSVIALGDDFSIVDYTIILDEKGRMSVENVKTKNGDAKDSHRAERMLSKLINSSESEELGMAILDVHDDEHGDVLEFKHRVVLGSDVSDDYRIESPDADRAALQEMQTLGTQIGHALGSYFKTTFGIDDPFTIHWDATGKLSIEGTADWRIFGVLNELNKRLSSDGLLNDVFKANYRINDTVFEKLLELQKIGNKFHDSSLKTADFSVIVNKKEGW